MWSVQSILHGLLSFMCEESHTAGSVVASREERRMMASMSMEFNKKTAMFRKLFPELIEEYDEKMNIWDKELKKFMLAAEKVQNI